MSKLVIEIRMENDAFADEPMTEAARILEKLARDLKSRAYEGPLYDINGNSVGRSEFHTV